MEYFESTFAAVIAVIFAFFVYKRYIEKKKSASASSRKFSEKLENFIKALDASEDALFYDAMRSLHEVYSTSNLQKIKNCISNSENLFAQYYGQEEINLENAIYFSVFYVHAACFLPHGAKEKLVNAKMYFDAVVDAKDMYLATLVWCQLLGEISAYGRRESSAQLRAACAALKAASAPAESADAGFENIRRYIYALTLLKRANMPSNLNVGQMREEARRVLATVDTTALASAGLTEQSAWWVLTEKLCRSLAGTAQVRNAPAL